MSDYTKQAILLDKMIAAGLLFTVVFTTLAHGAVEAWSAAIFQSLILLLLVLWTLKCLFERRVEVRLPLTAFPFAALLIYALIQSVVFTDATGQSASLSADAEATRGAARMLFFLLAAHVVAANFFATRERVRMLTNFLIVFGLAFAVFALVQHFTWNGSFFWLRATRSGGGMVTGSFVNHNHFAGFMELLIPIPIALVVSNAIRQSRILYALAATMMTIAAIAALSRGGMISLAAGGLFVLIAAVYKSRGDAGDDFYDADEDDTDEARRLPWAFNLAGGAIIAAAIVVGTLLVGSEPVLDRLTNNSVASSNAGAQNFDNARGWMWRNSWTIFRANPITGVGLGAYQTAFPNYSDGDGIRQYGKEYVFDRAHNDYLQILTDTGLIGGACAVWFAGALLLGIRRSLKLRNSLNSGLAIGLSAAVVSLAVHSFFDFNLQLPAIALLFLIVAAVIFNLPSLEFRWRMKRPKHSMLPSGREIKLLPPIPRYDDAVTVDGEIVA